MDSCVIGVSENDEIESYMNEATELLSSAGFKFRGWISCLDLDQDPENVLSLHWHRPSNEFGCRVVSWTEALSLKTTFTFMHSGSVRSHMFFLTSPSYSNNYFSEDLKIKI